VSSPPAEHGWTVLPIVHSRHPLWDQDDLHSGEERTERFVRALSEWPLRWRAAVAVGTASSRPQEVFRVANPSIWPIVAAGGVVLIFIAELFKFRWAIALGVVVLVVAGIMWNRPEEPPMTEEEEDAFEREHQVPVNAAGSVVISMWGMGMVMLFLGIALGALLLSYFYLRLENPAWPPPGTAEPPLTRMLLAAGLVAAATRAIHVAVGWLRDGRQRRFVVGLAVALALMVGGIAVQILDVVAHEFTWTAHAYGSIFYTLAGFGVVVAVGAVIMGTIVLYWALRGIYTRRRHATVANVARFWTAAMVMWVIGYGTLYLAPYLT
jgi:cytochrome c oxidase subunit I+III